MSWQNTARVADFATPVPGTDRVACSLCPRGCRPGEGQAGFCGVRAVHGGRLRALNYGRSVAATEEVIETEAVNHYAPGARILSLGNVGCMMACSFCQNWETSQVKHLQERSVRHYTPHEVVDICLAHGIPMISWTYNDPVVWHEFVVETSRLAQAAGIKTLYKSAFYIEREPVEELIDCIDVFSLSLKSMDDGFYRKVCKARLQPVLDRIEQVHASGRHLELSQLVIPELNDDDEDLRRTVDWVVDAVGTGIPLHFVAFHPAYQYTSVERTSPETLLRARAIAVAAGVRHCYLGNVFIPGINDTRCGCGATLVERYGLHARRVALGDDGRCTACAAVAPIAAADLGVAAAPEPVATAREVAFDWGDGVNSAHVHRRDGGRDPVTVGLRHADRHYTRRLGAGLDRFIVSKGSDADLGFSLELPLGVEVEILPVLDRAHFPVDAESPVAQQEPRHARRA